MPISRTRLSKVEQKKYVACLEELRAGGADIRIPPDWLDETCPLDIVLRPDVSREVFDGPHGDALYCISVRLVARQTPLILTDCLCETEWDQLEPLSLPRQSQSAYRFGNRSYSLAEVMNDRIETEFRFSYRGQALEGFILFAGFEPIPDRYRGRFAPFTLTFVDEFDHEIAVQSRLFVNRETKAKTADQRPSRNLQGTTEIPSGGRPPLVEQNNGSNASLTPTAEKGSEADSTPQRRRSTLFEPWESFDHCQSSNDEVRQKDRGPSPRPPESEDRAVDGGDPHGN